MLVQAVEPWHLASHSSQTATCCVYLGSFLSLPMSQLAYLENGVIPGVVRVNEG